MGWFAPQRPGRFVEVYIANLQGICLEWAVAAAEQLTNTSDYTSLQPRVTVDDCEGDVWLTHRPRERNSKNVVWEPLTNWLQLGALVDKYDMQFNVTSRDHPEKRWSARGHKSNEDPHQGFGPTRYTALLRTVVHINSKTDVIEVPLDLAEMSGTPIYEEHLERVYDSDIGEIIDLRKSQN